jgi:hypothetical protein
MSGAKGESPFAPDFNGLRGKVQALRIGAAGVTWSGKDMVRAALAPTFGAETVGV